MLRCFFTAKYVSSSACFCYVRSAAFASPHRSAMTSYKWVFLGVTCFQALHLRYPLKEASHIATLAMPYQVLT